MLRMYAFLMHPFREEDKASWFFAKGSNIAGAMEYIQKHVIKNQHYIIRDFRIIEVIE